MSSWGKHLIIKFCWHCSSLNSPPARWGLLDFIRIVLLLLGYLSSSCSSCSSSSCSSSSQHLLHHLCLFFHVHCCLANSSPSSLQTSELCVHRWTSTWDLPSSVGTAGLNLGPAQLSGHRWTQPGTCPAQCAPLDLNLGPAQLSVRRWTSTAR